MSLLWFILVFGVDVVLVVDIFVFIAYYWWKSHQVILCCCPTWLSLWWGEYLQRTCILLFSRSANNFPLFYAILLQTTLSQSVCRSSNDSLLYIFSDPDDHISFTKTQLLTFILLSFWFNWSPRFNHLFVAIFHLTNIFLLVDCISFKIKFSFWPKSF